MSELYLHFEDIFLGNGNGRSSFTTPCNHDVLVFDHHFFHLAAVTVPGKERLFMRDEKQRILATVEGFSDYVVGHGGSRAKNLRSAYETFTTPDEVWENNPKTQARWVYVKEYNSAPYPFSVALVTAREAQAIIVPMTSFPCRKGDIKKWRSRDRIYP